MFLFRNKVPFILSALGAFCALAGAYSAEYGFGLKPCELCHYQRIAFYLILIVAVFFAVWSTPRFLKRKKRGILVLLLLFFGNMGLAGYQVLVEQKIIAAPQVCRAQKASTLEELRQQLKKGPPVPCDKVAWSLFGLSMAGFGVLYNLGFILYLLLNFRVMRSYRAYKNL